MFWGIRPARDSSATNAVAQHPYLLLIRRGMARNMRSSGVYQYKYPYAHRDMGDHLVEFVREKVLQCNIIGQSSLKIELRHHE